MKSDLRAKQGGSFLSALVVVFVLAGCGGGDMEAVTLVKQLNPAPEKVAADGTLISSSFPPFNASQLEVDALVLAGVQARNKRCAENNVQGASYIWPSYVVLVDVDVVDLERAKASGFDVLPSEALKALKTFECSTRSI